MPPCTRQLVPNHFAPGCSPNRSMRPLTRGRVCRAVPSTPPRHAPGSEPQVVSSGSDEGLTLRGAGGPRAANPANPHCRAIK
jgi:hypothetical protein